MSDARIHNPAVTVTEDDRGLYVTGGFCPPAIDYANLPTGGGPRRRITRRQRLTWWRHDARERLALRLAPWLERDPYE